MYGVVEPGLAPTPHFSYTSQKMYVLNGGSSPVAWVEEELEIQIFTPRTNWMRLVEWPPAGMPL